MATSIPAVLAALTALAEATLDAADPFTAAQVVDGPYGTVTTHADRFLVVGSDDEDTPLAGIRELDSMGLTTASEQYEVPMGISVSLPGADTLDEVTVQAMADYAALEAAVKADPTLGVVPSVAAVHALVLDGFALKRRSDANVRNATVRFGVRVIAHLA